MVKSKAISPTKAIEFASQNSLVSSLIASSTKRQNSQEHGMTGWKAQVHPIEKVRIFENNGTESTKYY